LGIGFILPVESNECRSLFDYLAAGDTLDEFLRQFPSVTREQAIAVLALARDAMLTRTRGT
jgi:uncharacterized protein (DUF433 family)